MQNTRWEEPTKHDTRHEPAYTIAEASRYLHLPTATLRSWFVGRPYPTTKGLSHFAPLLKLARKAPPTLSFANLVEAHVLRSLRTGHGVPLDAVRKATYAQRELQIDQLLLREELRTNGGALFLDRYGALINLSASGQLAMRKVFESHLARVEWDRMRFPARLYPFLQSAGTDTKPILIDPEIAFGRPVVGRAFVSTRAILDRIDAGESVESVACDYEISTDAIEHAVVFERAA